MALYSQASDLQTRQTVWVGTNVVKGKSQRNSHTLGWDHDGLPTAELADVHTPWQGWVGPGHRYYCNPEAKRISFPA
jgi:hypothetical protein